MTMTREQVESLLSRAPEGPWRADGEPWNRIVWSGAENRVCFMAHSNGLNDDRDVAASDLAAAAPDLARALLAALDDLDAVKAERDKWHDLAAANGRAALDELAQVVAAEARAEAAEAANAAMTAREGVLRAFIDDFATAKIDALRYQPSYGESPEDEPDPVVDATEVWAWQSDAKDILALKETPDA